MPTDIISIHHTKGNCKADLKRRMLRLIYFILFCLPGEKNTLISSQIASFLYLRVGPLEALCIFHLAQRILITFYYDASQMCITVSLGYKFLPLFSYP